MTAPVYAWRGADRRGVGRCGQATFGPGELPARVEAWFRQRYRWLVIERDGLVVGQIKRDDCGRRIWYAKAGE